MDIDVDFGAEPTPAPEPTVKQEKFDDDDDGVDDNEQDDDDEAEDDAEDDVEGGIDFDAMFDESMIAVKSEPLSEVARMLAPATVDQKKPAGAAQPPVIDKAASRLRVNDVHVELSPSVVTMTNAAATVKQEPAVPTASGAPPVGALHLDHYDVAKRMAAEQRAAELAEGGTGESATSGLTSSKIGDTAAQVNHYLIAISDARQRVDPTILTQIPHVMQTTGAHIGRAFYMQAIVTAPHLSKPVSELTDVMRRLASEARCVRREHIEAMTRTPRLREEVCANKEGCAAMSFCDYYNRPLPDRRPLVAFLFEDELAVLRTTALQQRAAVAAPTPAAPAGTRQPLTRANVLALWKTRACVQCMIRAGNRLLANLRCKNQAIDARLYLAIPFYVEVDVAGEYPIGATLGPGKRVFESLIFNFPRHSDIGWMITMRADVAAASSSSTATTIGGGANEEVVYYVNVSVPPFPVPEATLRAHGALGFSAAL